MRPLPAGMRASRLGPKRPLEAIAGDVIRFVLHGVSA